MRWALQDRQDKLKKGNIHCHQSAPGKGEEGGAQCYSTLIIYPQIFSGTCNPHPAPQEHVRRVQAMRKSGKEKRRRSAGKP